MDSWQNQDYYYFEYKEGSRQDKHSAYEINIIFYAIFLRKSYLGKLTKFIHICMFYNQFWTATSADTILESNSPPSPIELFDDLNISRKVLFSYFIKVMYWYILGFQHCNNQADFRGYLMAKLENYLGISTKLLTLLENYLGISTKLLTLIFGLFIPSNNWLGKFT